MEEAERFKRSEKELHNTMKGDLGAKAQKENAAAYWKFVDELHKGINNMVAELLQQKCLLLKCGQSAETAERPDASGLNMECSHTGKRSMTIDWIDLESQAAYAKWKAESEHEPVIVEEQE